MSGLNESQIFLAKYHLSKKATPTIAGWIAETAASIGFDVKTKDQKQQKPKSKSKKGAKGRGKQKATGGSSSTVYQLGVSDFVPMAEAIAKAGEQAESEIMVPVALCRHFSRAIQTRRKARILIKILEDTFASLKPFLGTGGPEPARNNVSDTTTSGLSSRNRFAGLTVDELAAVADEEDIAEDTLSEFSGVKLEEVEEDKEDDFWVAVALMLQEQQDMREVVRENWEKYKSGEVDLVVAAMTTDTAIKLAQGAEAKFDLRTLRAIELAQVMRIIAKAVKRPPLLDMVSRGLLDMLSEHTIPMWLTYGVQLHFDSQDILGERTHRPHFELQVYLNHLIGSQRETMEEWEDPMMSKEVQYECYNPFKEAYNEMSRWANHDGFNEQWERLKKDPKVGRHPIFRKLESEPFYLYRHNPLL
ncbi:unnamed protein product [Alternaria sp. RS040]